MNLNSSRANGARSRNSRAQSIPPWAAILGGGALTVYGLSRKSLSGAALAAVGALGAVAGARRQTHLSYHRPRPEDLYHRSFGAGTLQLLAKLRKSATFHEKSEERHDKRTVATRIG